jgi:cob(I)alamin adenosyltransferase
LYTRGGDKGETGLYGSKRVPKDSPRVEAYGTIDELNSCIGIAISLCEADDIAKQLKKVQRWLFVSGADLASELPKRTQKDRVPRIGARDTKELERMIDELVSKVPRLTKFILPGGGRLAAQLHFARSVCRRAERRVVTLSRGERINPEIVPFMNRLSTYLFDLARWANAREGKPDEVWES